MQKSLLLTILIYSSQLIAQDKFTLNGYIKDKANGETLIGATIFVEEITGGAISNVYGFYSITLPKGTYHIRYRYVGFNTQPETLDP